MNTLIGGLWNRRGVAPAINRAAAALLAVAVVFLLGRMILFHYHLIVYPYQAEYREGADLLLTTAFARGIDPYALAVQPQYTNAYGFVSNLLTAPFVALWGPSFAPGRALAALADGLSCLLLVVVMRRLGVSLLLCLSAVILFDVGLIDDGSSILARADGLGLLLFLASICLPWLDDYSPRSLALSVLLALLAFYTKVYFVLGAFYLGPFLFLCVSKRKALVYGLVLALLLGVTAWIVDQRADFYFTNALFGHINGPENAQWALTQFVGIIRFYGLLWALLGLSLGLTILLRPRLRALSAVNRWQSLRLLPAWARTRFPLNRTPLSRPLFEGANTPLALFTLSLLLSALLLYLKLGRNHGANLTYYYQLLAPFALLLAFTLLARLRRLQTLVWLALIPTLWLTGQAQVARLASGPDDSSVWAHLGQVVSTRHDILNSPALTGLVIQAGLPIYDSGSTEFFRYAHDSRHNIAALYKAYRTRLREGVQQGAFDLVLLTPGWARLIDEQNVADHYRLRETLTLPMPYSFQTWNIELWVPPDR